MKAYYIIGMVVAIFLATLSFTITASDKPKDSQQESKKIDADKEKIEAAREFYNLGLVEFNGKRYEKAKDYFNKAISYDENLVIAYLRLGDTYMALKEEETACENYLKCLRIIKKNDEPSSETTKLREECLRKSEKFRGLQESFASINKNLATKLGDIGQQCFDETNYLLAEEVFTLILRIDNNNEQFIQSLQKSREEITKSVKESTGEANNELASVYYESGLGLLKQNKYDEAIVKFNKALSYRANWSPVLFKIGECYEKTKNNITALQNYRVCKKLLQQQDNRSKEEDELLSQATQCIGRLDVTGKQILKIKSEYLTQALDLARQSSSNKYPRLAITIVQFILQVDPDNKTAQELLNKGNMTVNPADKKEKQESTAQAKQVPNGFTAIGKNQQGYNEYRHEQTGLVFVLVPAGQFQMGSNDYDSEKPVHEVPVNSFLVSKYEVTQGVWQKIMGDNPSYFKKGDNYPVEQVSWNDCQEFCKKMGLRLPTEAEWEYACRAGTNTKYYWGDKEDGNYMWYNSNSGSTTHPVGEKKPNGLGLYDMSGNVWEWCSDWYGENYYQDSPKDNPKGPASGQARVLRGGSWDFVASGCRSASRGGSAPSNRYGYLGVGFRLVHDSK